MLKPILTFGAVSGAVIIISIIGTIEFDVPYQWLGYLIMLIALSAIFIAMKQYRDEVLNGSLTFLQGMQIGLGISGIATVMYVLGWEAYLALTDFAFAESYTEMIIAEQQANGASEAEIESLRNDMATFAEQYANPIFRVAVTTTELFPVGVLVSLVSAGLLRYSNK